MREALAEWSEFHHEMRSGVAKVAPSRRGFLMGAGVALGGLALAACGSSSKSSTPAGRHLHTDDGDADDGRRQADR